MWVERKNITANCSDFAAFSPQMNENSNKSFNRKFCKKYWNFYIFCLKIRLEFRSFLENPPLNAVSHNINGISSVAGDTISLNVAILDYHCNTVVFINAEVVSKHTTSKSIIQNNNAYKPINYASTMPKLFRHLEPSQAEPSQTPIDSQVPAPSAIQLQSINHIRLR